MGGEGARGIPLILARFFSSSWESLRKGDMGSVICNVLSPYKTSNSKEEPLRPFPFPFIGLNRHASCLHKSFLFLNLPVQTFRMEEALGLPSLSF